MIYKIYYEVKSHLGTWTESTCCSCESSLMYSDCSWVTNLTICKIYDLEAALVGVELCLSLSIHIVIAVMSDWSTV